MCFASGNARSLITWYLVPPLYHCVMLQLATQSVPKGSLVPGAATIGTMLTYDNVSMEANFGSRYQVGTMYRR